MGKLKLKIGDLFTIPLENQETSFGQIVNFPNSKDVFIMCVFDKKQNVESEIKPKEICESPVLLLGYSTDAKLYHKDWLLVGNYTENISKIVLPFHRLGTPPTDIYLVDYSGKRIKEIDEELFNQLSYQTSYSPIRYENALKAHFKLQEWKNDDYDKLLYEYTLKGNKIALAQV